MPLPANVNFCEVTGRFLRAVADTADPGRDPDGVPVAGLKIRFQASLNPAVVRNLDNAVTIVIDPIDCITDDNGVLLGPDGTPGVLLVASDDEDLDPHGWTWKVTVSGPSFSAITFSFVAPVDGKVDLSTVVPVPPNPGSQVSQWQAAVTATESARGEAVEAAGEAVAAKGDAVAAAERAEAVPAQVDTAMAEQVGSGGEFDTKLSATFVGYGQPVPNALTGWFHADGYGVDVTGATNAHTQFQAVMDAATALYGSTGKQQTVYWRGAVKLGASLVARDGVILRGYSRAEAKLICPTAASAIVYVGWFDEPLTDAEFRSFEVDGSLQTGGYNVAKKGIYTTFHENVVFENLYIHDTIATGLGVDHFHGNCIVRDNIIDNCGRGNDGFQPGGNGLGLGIGAWPDGIDSVLVEGNYVSGIGRFGIMVEQQDQATAGRGVRVIGNYVTDCQHGIVDCGATGAIIMGNQCIENRGSGIALNSGTFVHGDGPHPGSRGTIQANVCYGNAAHGIAFDFTGFSQSYPGYSILGNTCEKNGGAGIRLALGGTDARSLMVAHNSLYNNGLTTTDDGSKAGLSIAAPGGVGKFLDCEFSDNLVDGNKVYGIYVAAGLTSCSVERNRAADRQAVVTQTVGLFFNSSATLNNVMVRGNKLKTMATPMTVNSTTITECEFEQNWGYNPRGPVAVSVGSSPFTYTNGVHRGVLYVKDGTVSSITKGGVQLSSASNREIAVAPNEQVVITYTAAPTVVMDRL